MELLKIQEWNKLPTRLKDSVYMSRNTLRYSFFSFCHFKCGHSELFSVIGDLEGMVERLLGKASDEKNVNIRKLKNVSEMVLKISWKPIGLKVRPKTWKYDNNALKNAEVSFMKLSILCKIFLFQLLLSFLSLVFSKFEIHLWLSHVYTHLCINDLYIKICNFIKKETLAQAFSC